MPQAVETEINVQLGEFTLKKQQMMMLPAEVSDHEVLVILQGRGGKSLVMLQDPL